MAYLAILLHEKDWGYVYCNKENPKGEVMGSKIKHKVKNKAQN